MTEKVFVDSNILIYAYDADAGKKQRVAAEVLDTLWSSRAGVLSLQVLQEFYTNITRKLRRAVDRRTARELVRGYGHWTIQAIEAEDLVSASLLEERYRLQFWDALIVTAASLARATRLLSEDFQHGQSIAGITVENPFR